MAISESRKMELFETMLEYEHLSEKETYDGINYNMMADGMFNALKILGLAREYIRWSYGK